MTDVEVPFVAQNIVNQLADLWEAAVPLRQATNDQADQFVAKLLADMLTAAEVKVLTETASKVAYELGRKDGGEEIAAALERCEDDARRAEQSEGIAGNRGTAKTWFDLAAGYMRSAELAREISSQPSQDASDATSVPSEGPGTSEPSKAAKTPQERA